MYGYRDGLVLVAEELFFGESLERLERREHLQAPSLLLSHLFIGTAHNLTGYLSIYLSIYLYGLERLERREHLLFFFIKAYLECNFLENLSFDCTSVRDYLHVFNDEPTSTTAEPVTAPWSGLSSLLLSSHLQHA